MRGKGKPGLRAMGKAGAWVVRVPRADQDPAARAQIDAELRALDENLRMLGATIRVGNVSAGEAWAGKGVGIDALRAIGPATRERIQELKGLQVRLLPPRIPAFSTSPPSPLPPLPLAPPLAPRPPTAPARRLPPNPVRVGETGA